MDANKGPIDNACTNASVAAALAQAQIGRGPFQSTPFCPNAAFFEARLKENRWFPFLDRLLLLLHPVLLNRDRVLARMVRRRQRSWLMEQGPLPGDLPPLSREDQFLWWVTQNYPSEERIKGMAGAATRFVYRPKFSVIMPVYNTPHRVLKKCVESVLAQAYDNWELCAVDDASPDPDVREILAKFSRQDARVRVACLPTNQGICQASNAALKIASGEFIALLDHDDILWPNALYECAKLLNRQPHLDFIYSDEDKITEDGDHYDPFFKPDWSPDLLLSMMYTGHLSVYRRSMITELGNFRPEYQGSQDYDLALRVSERTSHIAHIPTILYSWRAIRGSSAVETGAKPWAVEAAQRVLQETLRRRGLDGSVEACPLSAQWRIRYRIEHPSLVSIIIPSGGNPCLLPCLQTLLQVTRYERFEIIVVDNSEMPDELQRLVSDCGAPPGKLRVSRFERRPFNFSAVVNHGVTLAGGDYIVLLNDDVTVEDSQWLEAMLEHAQRPEIGVVGAKLLYPDGRVQHAGVVLGIGGVAGHAFKYFDRNDAGPISQANVTRNSSAVTFACVMLRRSVFNELGGLDERNLAVAFNDVDFCLRAGARGYRTLYVPHAQLFHHESATRPTWPPAVTGETTFMRETWREALDSDPYYNPNLSLQREDWSLRIADTPLGPIV